VSVPAQTYPAAATLLYSLAGSADLAPVEGALASDLLLNRELSLIAYDGRVLERAADGGRPLLERVRSLAFFATNTDEFFMIRVSGLRAQVAAGLGERSPDGLSPAEQLAAIHAALAPLFARQQDLWRRVLIPALAAAGVRIAAIDDLAPDERAALDSYYQREVCPALTPLAVDPGHPFPQLANRSLNLAVLLDDPGHGRRFARLKIPSMLPRFVPLPAPPSGEDGGDGGDTGGGVLVPLEDLIAAHAGSLFPGLRVIGVYPFHVLRDADLALAEDEAADLSASVRDGLRARRFGAYVRLAVTQTMPDEVRSLLMDKLALGPSDAYAVDGMLALDAAMDLYDLDRPDLKDPPIAPRAPTALRPGEDIFAAIRRRDILLHHPYDAFTPVVDLLRAAARDPAVLAIKQTLYRVGGSQAPVVDALLEAAEAGKQVAVLVELKARFDEETNIEWARALEEAGAHVAYGLVGLKTHAKLLLIVRREQDGLRRYVHLSTGNYNAGTARGYTDLGLLTARPELGADVAELFNYLTGYSHQDGYRRLLVAPFTMRRRLCQLIEGETMYGEKGHIVLKTNALVDGDIIAALYRAARAGVRVELLVRGVCCLRPGAAGTGDRIRVTSLVGRFLEHSRIYYFAHAGADGLYIGSADLMPRNLDRRVETLVPVEDPALRRRLLRILAVYRRDRANAHALRADGSYAPVAPVAPVHPQPTGVQPFDAQSWFLRRQT